MSLLTADKQQGACNSLLFPQREGGDMASTGTEWHCDCTIPSSIQLGASTLSCRQALQLCRAVPLCAVCEESAGHILHTLLVTDAILGIDLKYSKVK